MVRHYFFIAFFFIINQALAQSTISGRVIDEKTNQGISGASVYVNNSTFGGQTDANGSFTINCKLLGKTTLIISHIGYERKVQQIEATDIKNLVFSLTPQINRLNEVVIKSQYKREDVIKWLALFTSNLIGVYKGSNHSTKLKNNNALYFDFDKSTNNLQAFAKVPLIIENDFLNYKIRVDLEQFEYNFNTDEIIFKYFVFYENSERKILTTSQIRKNRIFAYEGSSMHFMRLLYKDKIDDEGFGLSSYAAELNKEKARVEKIIRQKTVDMYTTYNNPDVSIGRLFSGDTLKHYKDVLKQESVLKTKLSPVTARKFTTKVQGTESINFNFPDTLVVFYDLNKSSLNKRISDAMKKGNEERTGISNHTGVVKPKYLYTCMYLLKPGGINIRSNGYYPELGLFMWGDMADRRIALSLPYDFDVTSP